MTPPVDVETFAANLSDRQLTCRRLGHPWRHHNVIQDLKGFTEILRCSSCRTERVDVLDRRGHLLSRLYRYPEGYQAANVTGGVKGQRDLFRLEALTRLTERAAQRRDAS